MQQTRCVTRAPTGILLLTLLVCVSWGGSPGASTSGSTDRGPTLRLLRPSAEDFVEVIQGGDQASDVVVDIAAFSVPRDGYILLSFGDWQTILCPQSVASVDECSTDGEQLNGTQRLSLHGTEIGDQEVCVSLYAWGAVGMVAHKCHALRGVEHFPGALESFDYFLDSPEEFLGPAPLQLLWERLALVLSPDKDLATLHVTRIPEPSGGGQSPTEVLMEAADASEEIRLIVCIECVEGATVLQSIVRGQPREQVTRLAEPWSIDAALHSASLFAGGGAGTGGEESPRLRQIHIDESANLTEALQGAAGALTDHAMDALTFALPAGQNRSELLGAIAALRVAGFRTLLAGTARLLALDDFMCCPALRCVRRAATAAAAAAPPGLMARLAQVARGLQQRAAERGRLAAFCCAPRARPALRSAPRALQRVRDGAQLRTAAGGLLPRPRWVSLVPRCAGPRAVGAHSGRMGRRYWADDCPPNFSPYRTSRVRLFERAELRPWLHPHSLLHFRHNRYSEAGEDGIVRYLATRLGFPARGFCFEFGAWDGIFASNCRHWSRPPRLQPSRPGRAAAARGHDAGSAAGGGQDRARVGGAAGRGRRGQVRGAAPQRAQSPGRRDRARGRAAGRAALRVRAGRAARGRARGGPALH
jgi:hypothetical protein